MPATYNASDSIWSGPTARWVWPLVLLVIGFCFVPLVQTCGFSCFPGDLGDARFNDVVLEHFYRWMTGQERSLLSPPFFYPMPGALTFSDNHWGTAWVYSIFRLLGGDRYIAFDLWYLTAFVVNFSVSNYVFRRLGFSAAASAVAAFAFTFAMPVVAKSGHAQLVWRAFVPLGLLCWQRFRETSSWRWIGRLALAVAGQFFISIYLGYFLLLFLTAWAASQWLLEGWGPRAWFRPLSGWRDPATRKELVVAFAMILVATLAIALLMGPYLHYAHLYGFRRSRDEIASMLPRPASYLISDLSTLWRPLSAEMGPVPMRAEQQMFFGLGALGLAALGVWRSRLRMRWLAATSLLFLVVLTLSVDGHALYLLLARLPGVDSIRAVARIGLIMALPLALLIAMAVDEAREASKPLRVLAFGLVAIMVVESITITVSTTDIGEARARIAKLVTKVPSDFPGGATLFNPLRAGEDFYTSELDGVILGQDIGHPTLNGYSGNIPPGYEPRFELSPCVQALTRMRGSETFFAGRLKKPLPHGAEVLPLVLGSSSRCDQEVMEEPGDAELSRISLQIVGLATVPDGVQVRVLVHNDTDHALRTRNGGLHPLRLSWQPLRDGLASDPAAWVPRITIPGVDPMMPGETRELRFVVPPPKSDTSRLAVSGVLEGRTWLHDHGVAPVIGTFGRAASPANGAQVTAAAAPPRQSVH